jgi:hypothetical protein
MAFLARVFATFHQTQEEEDLDDGREAEAGRRFGPQPQPTGAAS